MKERVVALDRVFIGLDFGTQSARSALVDERGRVLAAYESVYETAFPKPGYAEQNPADWERSLVEILSACAGPHDIAGIAVCATSSTVLAVDADMRPLGPAVMWMDTRATTQASAINATKHEVLRYCGGAVSPEWIVPKVLHFKQTRPELYARARFIEQQDYINYLLCGEAVPSACQATCKHNYVPERGGFDDTYFAGIGLAEYREKLNTGVMPPAARIGRLSGVMARTVGLKEGIPLFQGGVDAHMAMLGLGVCREGDMGVAMGSSFVHLALASKPVFDESIWGPYQGVIVPGLYCLEGGQISAGSITKWFLKTFNVTGDDAYMRLAHEADTVPPGADGLVMLDYFQGNRTPYKDARAKGVFYGLTLAHERRHLYRAVLEGVSMGTKAIIVSMERAGIPITTLKACSGVTNNPIWMQMLADISQKPLEVPENAARGGVCGCAILCAVGTGTYGSYGEAVDQMVRVASRVEPNPALRDVYEDIYHTYSDIYASLKHIMHKEVKP